MKMGQSVAKQKKCDIRNLKYNRWIKSEINMIVRNIEIIINENKKVINKLYKTSVSRKIIIKSDMVNNYSQKLFINKVHTSRNFWMEVSYILSKKYGFPIKIINIPSIYQWKPDEFQIILII